MIKNILFVSLFVAGMQQAFAQTRFFPAIKVEFEKTVSVRQLMLDLHDDEDNNWIQDEIKNLPVTALSYYEFTGDSTKSIYKPIKEVPVNQRSWYRPVGDKNIVYTDYQNKTTISQKPVYEETFLLQDSLLKIKWKLTSDVRSIAGFECRKAIGILNDTIAVFAFYTDELLVNGGPEGIQGLPGMILGMGIPRLHATWFATKVEVFDINMSKVVPATKGKKVDRTSLLKALDPISKSWGTYGRKLILNFVL